MSASPSLPPSPPSPSKSRSPRRRSRSPRRRGSPSPAAAAGRSPRRSASPRGRDDPFGRDTMKLTDDDIAFVLGKGGATKMKLARVSGATLEISERDMQLEISGALSVRRRAREYVDLVLAQRVGPVQIDFDAKRDDLRVVEVPQSAVGYVTGGGGRVLRSLEAEWGTLMFFAKPKGDTSKRDMEKLAIFGPKRGRRGAELKVLSAVESKVAGFVINAEDNTLIPDLMRGVASDEDWGVDVRPLAPSDFSYALGRKGSTREKLCWSSGCIIQYIGGTAVFAGTAAERKRGIQYLEWLIAQRTGAVHVDTSDRDDVSPLEVPRSVVGFITGAQGNTLRNVEHRTGSFIFIDGKRPDASAESAGSETERLLIFSHKRANRQNAEDMIKDMIKQKLRDDDRRGGRGPDDRDRYDDRGRGGYGRDRYDDRRDRYDDRRDRYDDRGRGGYDRGYDDRGRGGYGGRGGHDDRRDRDRDRYYRSPSYDRYRRSRSRSPYRRR